MKMAYVINSLEGGGAQSPIPHFFRVLKSQGVDVKLYALSKRNGLAIPILDAANVNWTCFTGHKKEHIKAALWLRKELRRDSPDVIWTSLTQATLIGQILGLMSETPVVSWQHNTYLKPANKALLKLTKSLSKLWVTDSQAVKDLMVERLGLNPEKTVIWPLFFADSKAPQVKAIEEDEPVRIASLGRLHPNKGYDILLEAIAKLKSQKTLPPFEINIAGQGAQKQNLDALKEKLDVTEVNFVGHVTDPLAFLSAHHAYIQPSRAEGLGIAAHEAMQAGLPILCSRVGQMALTNQDARSGWLCEPENIDSLAKSLDSLLSNRESLHLYGQKIRRTVLQDYSQACFDEAGRDFLDHIRRCLMKSPSPSVVVEGA